MGQYGFVVDMGIGGNNKIIVNNVVFDMYWGRFVIVDVFIVQMVCFVDLVEIFDMYIFDRIGIENYYMVVDGFYC